MSEEPEQELPQELINLRASIDNLDAAFIHVMAERFKITKRIGYLKAEHNLPAVDKEREARQVRRMRQLAVDADLDPDIAEKLLNFVVKEVVQYHVKIAESKDEKAQDE